MKDYKVAALNLYPEDFFSIDDYFSVDNNAGRRSVAEGVFDHTFERIKSEQVAKAVVNAYERRRTGDESIDFVHMSTALMAVIISIRGENENA